MSVPADESAPLVWRIPAYQPALLLLFVCGCAALNLYGHPSSNVRIFTLAFGLLALGCAVAALRMHLIADTDGVAVRQLRSEAWTPWPEVAEFVVVHGVRGASTLRMIRTDGSFVDVPPSLLQPSRPTGKQQALAQLDGVLRQLSARRPRRR